jgi:predicted amidophosphoribosyltransferase
MSTWIIALICVGAFVAFMLVTCISVIIPKNCRNCSKPMPENRPAAKRCPNCGHKIDPISRAYRYILAP